MFRIARVERRRLGTARWLLGAALVALGSAPGAGTAGAQDKPFEGITVNVMTFTGPQIAEPLQRRAPEFKELTGATINVITVPFSDLYTRLLTDWASGTNSIDAAVLAPQWMVDYVQGGYLEDLTDRVVQDEELQLEDIAPFFREFSQQCGGRTYLLSARLESQSAGRCFRLG